MKMTKIQKIIHRRELRIVFWFFIIATVISSVFLSPTLGDEQKKLIQTELPQPAVPQPQLFCGYCHVLTYPGIVQKGYELWKKGKHNKYGCVECHYPPKQAEKMIPVSTTDPAFEKTHIPKKPPDRFSYLPLGGETIKTRPRIVDASCMTAGCHGKPEDKFKTKKIKFTEKVFFVHKPHLEKKNQIEGQKINCTSCHQHETENKKFEVTKASCHLCHFKNTKFNQDRGKCELCHELPQKPIQTSGEKPITHQMLKDAGVSCASCHLDVIQASGGAGYEAYFEKGELKAALVIDAGRVDKENCLACHDQPKALKEDRNKKLMHEKHVAIKNSRCFDCHRQVRHTRADLEKTIAGKQPQVDLKQSIRNSCTLCHAEPHRYQRMLAEGLKREGVLASPDPMFKARTNCLGCHIESKRSGKGLSSMTASAETCVKCHTKDHRKMLKDWKTELAKELVYARDVEKEALEAFNRTKPKLSKEKLEQANQRIERGRDYLNIIEFGNGVHNKKYAIMLIDAAITRFEDMIDDIENVE